MSFHIGQRVVMNNRFLVPEEHQNRVWVVESEPWQVGESEMVRLIGYSGGYLVEGLDPVGYSPSPLTSLTDVQAYVLAVSNMFSVSKDIESAIQALAVFGLTSRSLCEERGCDVCDLEVLQPVFEELEGSTTDNRKDSKW